MDDKTINYEALTQNAMRNMVRNLLADVAATGLPGEHHFYITFKTRAAHVQLADSLLASHPQEMTIVLQHQYKDLTADEEGFAVTLSFNQTPHKLYIPYAAMISFYDPSAEFGLRFNLDNEAEEDTAPDSAASPSMSVEETSADEIRPVGDNIVSIDQFRDK
jgi:hypothetical protein